MPKKTKADPTGQNSARNKGTRTLQRRLTMAERGVKALFKEIPRERRRQAAIVNADEVTYYDYDYPPSDQMQLAANVQALVNTNLVTTAEQMPPDWYWQDNIEQPYRQGTLETVNSMNQEIAAAIVAGATVGGVSPRQVDPESILLNQAYRERLQNVYVTNYSNIKGMSDQTTAQVMQQINAGIKAKQSPQVIAASISDRFDVARSKAKQIAETNINQAYTDSKMDANNIIAATTGLRSGVIHISALTPTTRDHHARRHGNAYTVEQQRQWWDEGANRINCKCDVISVLIDRNGKVINTQKQREIQAERAFFD